MIKILTHAIAFVVLIAVSMTPICCWSASDLMEFRGTALPLAIHPEYKLEVLPEGYSELTSVISTMPVGFAHSSALRIKPTGSTGTFVVFVGTGQVETADGSAPATHVAIINPLGIVFALPLDTMRGNGNLERICIYPAGPGSDNVVFLLGFSQGPNSTVYGYTLGSDNQLWNLDCSSARTLYGWFNVSDLDGDGDFELLTTRSMDGVPGGFSYSAVRELNAVELRYVGAPDGYRAHFEKELKWMDWVVNTQALIQADPDGYVNPLDQGPFFIAKYEGKSYGFDSIIELPVPEGNYSHLERFNTERRVSIAKVIRYRDDLSAWLSGGSYPIVWNMSR